MHRPSTHRPRHHRAALSKRGGLRLAAAGYGALALAVGVATGWGSVPLLTVALLAAVVAVSELVVLPAGSGSSRWPATVTEGAVGACLLVGDGAWSVVAVGVGVAAAQAARPAPRRRRELDLAVRLLATALAQAACSGVGGGLGGALVGVAVFWGVGCVLLATTVAAISARPVPSLLVWIARRSVLHAAGSAGFGLLAASLALHAPMGLLGLAAGVAVVHSACAHAAWRSGEVRVFTDLVQELGRTPDAAAQLLVTAAARLLRGADVELVVLDGPLARRYAGDERGWTGSSSDVVALDEQWVLETLTHPGTHRSLDSERPTLTTVLDRPGGSRAVLRARRPAGAPEFDREDLRSMEVLVTRSDVWLGAPEATATGEPAVVRVRASVARLDALAVRGAGLTEAAEELLELERAVASLLGSATPAETDVPAPRPSPTPEWTTTGVVR